MSTINQMLSQYKEERAAIVKVGGKRGVYPNLAFKNLINMVGTTTFWVCGTCSQRINNVGRVPALFKKLMMGFRSSVVSHCSMQHILVAAS